MNNSAPLTFPHSLSALSMLVLALCQKKAAGDWKTAYNNKEMKIILCMLLAITHCALYQKISTQLGNSLTASDYLLSTLGLFRMTLNQSTCQLQIETFNTTNYVIVGFYPRTALSPCKWLTISNNSFVSNTNTIILSLQAAQVRSAFDEVLVTIDQMGIIRINGVYSKKYQSSQNWISIFRTPRQYIYSISNLSVTIYSSLAFVQNGGNWGFSATNGQLRLFKIDDVSKIIRYNYTSFTITPNNLFDYNSNSLPLANYNEFRYYSTCSPNGYLENFQAPLVFVVNPYWPEIRLLDRNGHEIIAIRYPHPHCSGEGVNYLQDTDTCMSWFCPVNTFQFNGNCVAVCPSPYFHQIGKNGINRCVLNCQANFNKDSIRRVCACGPLPSYQCPDGLKATPLGCLCPASSYFNPYNQGANGNLCYSSCGAFLFPHKDGICVPCPKQCQICYLSQNSFNYLTCFQCMQGFQVNSEGYCTKKCETKIDANGACLKCKVANCSNCSESLQICKACSKPHSLFNNSCVVQCPRGFKSQFTETGFQCVLVPGCSAQTTIANLVNNQSSCFCTRNGNPSYARACGNQSAKDCTFDSYFDSNTLECLACPIGCLTCFLDVSNRIQCTACRPEYSLFITLSKNHYCERNSILSICPNIYNFATQICSLPNLAQATVAIKTRSSCLSQSAYCMVCASGSSTLCSICLNGYFLLQGTCVESCPSGSVAYQYQKVCIPIVNSNCLAETTQSAYYLFLRTKANQNADGYFYLISVNFQASDFLNDPLGSLYTFLRTSDIQSLRRLVNIASSYQRCTRCELGYGLTRDGKCKRCIFPCSQCTFYSTVSSFCLRCDSRYKLNSNHACEKLDITQLPCAAGEYRNQSRICQSDCITFVRDDNISISQSNRIFNINCTLNCPNGYSVTPYTNANGMRRLKCSKINSATPSISFLGGKIMLGSSALYVLISSNKLSYDSDLAVNVDILTSTGKRLLSDTKRQVIAYSTDFGFVITDSSPSLTDSSILVHLPAASISSVSGSNVIFPANSVYGFDSNSLSFADVLFNETSNLYYYGRAYFVVACLLTIVFLAEQLSYKTDNLFATFSVVYLVLPSLNLQPDSSSLNSYSFLYGFSWSSHLQFFSNPRLLTQQSNWFGNYLQTCNNNAHYLLFVDNNIIRNGWSILLALFVAIGILGLMAIIMKCLSVKKVKYTGSSQGCIGNMLTRWSKIGYNSNDFNHANQVTFFLLFLIQNSFMGLCYYSFLNITNTPWKLASSQKQQNYKIISYVLLALMVIYTVIRAYTNRIGGLYCLKRILLGFSLGLVSYQGGVDQNMALTLLLLLIIEIGFSIMRYKVEFVTDYLFNLIASKKKVIDIPRNKIKTRHTLAESPKKYQQTEVMAAQEEKNPQSTQFWVMIGQEILIMAAYIFLALINHLKEVSVLIIWIVLTVFMVSLILDFVDLVVDYWSKTYSRKAGERPIYKRIRNNWDHELSLKSLASTADL